MWCAGRYTLTIVKGTPQPSSASGSSLDGQRAPPPGSGHQRQSSAASAASAALSEAGAGIEALVRRHVDTAQLLSRAGGEISFRLPKADAPRCAGTRAPAVPDPCHLATGEPGCGAGDSKFCTEMPLTI